METEEGLILVPIVDDLDEVAEHAQGHKVLRIVMEFKINNKKTHSGRLKEAYLAAVQAADEALRTVLLKNSIKGLTTQMTYGYRQLEGNEITWEVATNPREH